MMHLSKIFSDYFVTSRNGKIFLSPYPDNLFDVTSLSSEGMSMVSIDLKNGESWTGDSKTLIEKQLSKFLHQNSDYLAYYDEDVNVYILRRDTEPPRLDGHLPDLIALAEWLDTTAELEEYTLTFEMPNIILGDLAYIRPLAPGESLIHQYRDCSDIKFVSNIPIRMKMYHFRPTECLPYSSKEALIYTIFRILAKNTEYVDRNLSEEQMSWIGNLMAKRGGISLTSQRDTEYLQLVDGQDMLLGMYDVNPDIVLSHLFQ